MVFQTLLAAAQIPRPELAVGIPVAVGMLALTSGLAAAVLLLMLVAFVSLFNHLNRMLYGAAPAGVVLGESRGWKVVALTGCAAALVVLGVALPWPVTGIIERSVSAVVMP